jgi:hypothetical protein
VSRVYRYVAADGCKTGSGGIWFSTNWVGHPPSTAEQVLGGGNLEAH